MSWFDRKDGKPKRVVNRLRIGNGEECTHLKFYLSKRGRARH